MTGPLTTVNAASPDFGALGSFPGFYAVVDGSPYTLPKNFNALFDGSTWAAGQAHTVRHGAGRRRLPGHGPPSRGWPVHNQHHLSFSDWTGSAGTVASNSLPFTVAGNQAFTANQQPSFRWIVLPSPFTSSCDSVSPSANNQYLDQFFTNGAPVSLGALPSAGSAFVGWSQDLTGTANPGGADRREPAVCDREFQRQRRRRPVAGHGLHAGQCSRLTAASTLTINGTGFVNNGAVYVYYNGSFRTSTYVSPTKYSVQLQAGDLATAATPRSAS